METRSGVEHFWTAPGPGESILGMVKYEDMIVVATTDGIYYITPPNGRGLMDHEIRKMSHDSLSALRGADR
jgi:hypothetical protein